MNGVSVDGRWPMAGPNGPEAEDYFVAQTDRQTEVSSLRAIDVRRIERREWMDGNGNPCSSKPGGAGSLPSSQIASVYYAEAKEKKIRKGRRK